MRELYALKTKNYKILGQRRITKDDNASKTAPEIKVDFLLEYNWQMMALNSRIKYPELYEHAEDVQRTIAKIKKWIEENPVV